MDKTKTIVHFTYSWITSGVCGFITDAVESCSGFNHKIVVWYNGTGFYDKRLNSANVPVVSLGGRDSSAASMPAAAKAFRQYLKENRADAVHIHCSCAPELIFARAAEKAGIPVRIAHCHNAGFEGEGAAKKAKEILNGISQYIFAGSPTERLACSVRAAETLYRKNITDRGNYRIIKNGIDPEKYSFSSAKRDAFRKEHGLEDKTVLCAVGRLSAQKNPVLLINSFAEYHKRNSGSALIIAGDGPLRSDCEKLAENLGISDNVIFLGSVQDIAGVLSAGDIFIMCSAYEGFGTAALEAQANGIPCVLSDSVSPEADVSGTSLFISGDADSSVWAEKIQKASEMARFDGTAAVIAEGYTKTAALNELTELYKEIIK